MEIESRSYLITRFIEITSCLRGIFAAAGLNALDSYQISFAQIMPNIG